MNKIDCVSVTMYPFLHDGLSKIGGLSASPKNLDSFCGMYVNLIFAVSAQFAGAVATPELLVFFDYFAKKEFGDDYHLHYDEFYKIGSDLRKLFNASGKWFKNINVLREYDFGSDELNSVRDKIVYNAERELTDEELKEWEANAANDEFNPVKLGDSTRTIGSAIHQYFQQIV